MVADDEDWDEEVSKPVQNQQAMTFYNRGFGARAAAPNNNQSRGIAPAKKQGFMDNDIEDLDDDWDAAPIPKKTSQAGFAGQNRPQTQGGGAVRSRGLGGGARPT